MELTSLATWQTGQLATDQYHNVAPSLPRVVLFSVDSRLFWIDTTSGKYHLCVFCLFVCLIVCLWIGCNVKMTGRGAFQLCWLFECCRNSAEQTFESCLFSMTCCCRISSDFNMFLGVREWGSLCFWLVCLDRIGAGRGQGLCVVFLSCFLWSVFGVNAKQTWLCSKAICCALCSCSVELKLRGD